MTIFEDRLVELRQSVERAQTALAELPVETRDAAAETLSRLERVLGYSGLVLAGTDGDLVTETTEQAVAQQLNQIAGDPATAAANAEQWGDALLLAMAQLPAARGNDVAQAGREAAANYQRSVQQRLHVLKGELDGLQASIAAAELAVTAGVTETRASLDGQISDFAATLTGFDQKLANERSLIEDTKTAQAETFREAQELRDQAFKKTLSESQEDLAGALEAAAADVAARVAEIQRMETESSALVGAIGLAGTAERYGEEVLEQRKAADFWRWCTVALVGLAVVGLAVIVFTLGDDPAWEEVAGKLSASLLLGGIATYASRQSARHRHREEHARTLQLELTAFGPFIEPLTPDQQEEERVVMTRKTFGKASARVPSAGEEPGPSPLSNLLRRKERPKT